MTTEVCGARKTHTYIHVHVHETIEYALAMNEKIPKHFDHYAEEEQ